MHVFLWNLRSANRLSTNEHMHLKGYTTEFLHVRTKKHLMILKQEPDDLYPGESNIFNINNYKARFI